MRNSAGLATPDESVVREFLRSPQAAGPDTKRMRNLAGLAAAVARPHWMPAWARIDPEKLPAWARFGEQAPAAEDAGQFVM